MAKIEQYDAPPTRLRPSETGVDAFTRAGRYMGQYYRQIASDQADIGKLSAQEIRERGWPFDILALEQNAAKSTGRGVNFRVSGGSREEDPFGQFSQKPLGRFDPQNRVDADPANPLAGSYATHGQVSRGARAVGRAASGLGTAGLPSRDSVIDTSTGIDLNNLSPAQVRARQVGPDGIRGPYTLEDGRFVPAGQKADDKSLDKYNDFLDKRDQDYRKQWSNWDQYTGGTYHPGGESQPGPDNWLGRNDPYVPYGPTAPEDNSPGVLQQAGDVIANLPAGYEAGAEAFSNDLKNWIGPSPGVDPEADPWTGGAQ